jgi:ABC-2 type transport system ATP-binding protein
MALCVSKVRKRFGGRTVLEEVSLRLEPGEIYGFLGQNGSGKTTLMRIILGLQAADGGEVRIDGYEIRSEGRQARARVGALVEIPGVWERWSGLENLTELGRLMDLSASQAAAEAQRVLQLVGLEFAADRKAGTYSQGMRQRLGIAAALLGQPRYLLLDEPFNGLDPENLAQIRALLKSLAAGGVGVLISSHQLAEIAPMTTKVGVIKDGRIAVEASADELLRGKTRDLVVETAAPAERAVRELGWEPQPHARGWLIQNAPPASELARALIERGIPFEGLFRAEKSLEEVYLSIQHGQLTQAASAPAPTQTPGTRIETPAGMGLALGHEWRRWSRSRGLLWICLLPSLVAVGAALSKLMEARAMEAEVAAGRLASASGVTGFELVARGMLAGLPMLGLVGAGLASQSIAAEQARGTLRNVLLRSIERWQWSLGKWLAATLAVLLSYSVLGLALCGFAALTAGFGDVVEVLATGEPFVITKAAELRADFTLAWIAPLGAVLATMSLGFLAGNLARGAATALAVALGLVLGLDVLRVFVRGDFLLAQHMPSPLGDASYPRLFLELSQGISTQLNPSVPQAWITGILWILVTILLSTWLLRKKSVS